MYDKEWDAYFSAKDVCVQKFVSSMFTNGVLKTWETTGYYSKSNFCHKELRQETR